MNNDEKKVILDDELLDEVAGGRVKLTGYALLASMMAFCKHLGKTKEECVGVVRHSWETDSKFKMNFTDGTDEDLADAIAYVEKNW